MEEIIFPNQIRMYRRLRGRSMQELADHLGVSLSAISKIEKGYRRIDQEQLVRVAELLDCPMQDLFVNEQNSQEDVVLPGGGNKKEETKSTKSRTENARCRVAANPQRKNSDFDRSCRKFGHDLVGLSPD